MSKTVDHPVAVRATAFMRASKWRQRPVRLLRYDAYWPDGRVAFDVNLSTMMYRGYPADFATVDASVHAHCPEVGAGQWVGESGGILEGPTQPEPNPPENVKGTPSKYGVPRFQSHKKVTRRLRVGLGVAILSLGIYLVTGHVGAGFAGFVGALCCIFGMSALLGLVRKPYRRW